HSTPLPSPPLPSPPLGSPTTRRRRINAPTHQRINHTADHPVPSHPIPLLHAQHTLLVLTLDPLVIFPPPLRPSHASDVPMYVCRRRSLPSMHACKRASLILIPETERWGRSAVCVRWMRMVVVSECRCLQYAMDVCVCVCVCVCYIIVSFGCCCCSFIREVGR
ncbi:uncharacterized protein IWZ02DRAFT_440449, partial [Phyllosticta citriasiana]|uniref:uncharacterized protein n=1 Tax=Phyllosticta citriasiana TaxID=595635 RepID=UPI0030FDA857